MNRSETDFWNRTVRPALSSFGVLHRIENLIELGTPDVTYCLRRDKNSRAISGWIETKFSHGWPARQNTVFKFKHFTMEQAEWLEEWGRFGKACLLVQVGDDFLLVPPQHCKEIQKGVTQTRFGELASVRSSRAFPTGRVLLWLTDRS